MGDERKGIGQGVRPDLGDKKVSGLPRGKERFTVEPQPDRKKDWVGSGCGSGIDSKSGKRKSGFSDRASRAVLGKLCVRSEDTSVKDAEGKKIGNGDLLLPSPIGCASGVGKFNRTA